MDAFIITSILMDILPQLLVNSLISGSIYALAAAGLAIVYGIMGILNFAHGHLMMSGAYLFYLVHIQLGLSIPLASLFTAIGMIIVSALTMRIFITPFMSYSPFLAFVTTLALGTILESLVAIFFGVNVKSLSTNYYGNSIELFGAYITPIQITIIVSALILLGILAFVVHSTSIGRSLRGISEHTYAVQGLGVSDRKLSYIAFTIATLLTAYAGIMVGFETNIQPTMGSAYTIKVFAAMILGGLGNVWGTIAGSYILGTIENLAIGLDFGGFSLPAGYKDAFAFFIILVVLLFRPTGLFKKKSRTT